MRKFVWIQHEGIREHTNMSTIMCDVIPIYVLAYFPNRVGLRVGMLKNLEFKPESGYLKWFQQMFLEEKLSKSSLRNWCKKLQKRFHILKTSHADPLERIKENTLITGQFPRKEMFLTHMETVQSLTASLGFWNLLHRQS